MKSGIITYWLMSLNWHSAYILRGMYPFTPSLTHLLAGQEDEGRNCHWGFGGFKRPQLRQTSMELLPARAGRTWQGDHRWLCKGISADMQELLC